MSQGRKDGNHTGGQSQALGQTPGAGQAAVQQRGLSIEQALMLASRLQGEGKLQQAENLVVQVLQAQPRHAPAWHVRGLIALGAGRQDLAREFLGRAVECDGNIALFQTNLGELNRQMKNVPAAIACGEKAVALNPRLVSAQSNLGIAYFDNKEYDKAEACHREALKLDPNCAPSLNNLGSIVRERRDYDTAIALYQKARAAQPDYLEPLNNLGATLARLDRHEEALRVLDAALAKNPQYVEALCNKGFAFLGLEQTGPALACFARAQALRPDSAEAWLGIARTRKDEYLLDEAETAVRRAIELDRTSDALCMLGSIQAAQGKPDLAREAFNAALEVDPACNSARMGLGNLLLEEGRFSEAEEIFRAAATDSEERMSTLFSLVQARKVKKTDPELAELEALDIAALPPNKAMFAHFALGKAYDDTGEADKAFPHFLKGCAIKRARLTYDADAKERDFARLREIFSKDFIDSRRSKGFASDKPIFVLGMPRSGTTLTEQIIASHPDVFGAGEIYDLLDIAGSTERGGGTFPENMPGMTDAGFAELGRRYVEGLEKRKPDARKLTDKMPINFLHIGLIHLILPQAKIVHVSRHPLDTCISCFTRLFAHNQDGTYELKDLGRFYKAYNDVMKHWRKVLPAGSFYDIRYEDLVDNTETQARSLIEYCGLDWNDACLEFYKHERNIRTASLLQVRQPIYKSSVARWKKYEKFLGPLIEGLGDALARDDM
jgi:tetratricopeptide (TPR) repeat protein